MKAQGKMGQTISDIQQYNVLASALMTQNTGTNWHYNVGTNMIGCGNTGAHQGMFVSGSANPAENVGSVTVCLPFILTALSGTTPTRYIPAFGRDSLRFRYYLDSQANAFTQNDLVAPITNSTGVISIHEVEAVMYIVELSPSAQQLVSAMCGNVYNILCADWRTANGSFAGTGAPLTNVTTLGFSVSSLERVVIVHRDSANQGTILRNSIGARSTATLNEFQLILNGEAFPSRPILAQGNVGEGRGAEMLAETLVAQHALSDFGHESQLANAGQLLAPNYAKFQESIATGIDEANTGTFVCGVELESMAGKSSNIYSGISTIGSVVQFRGVYTAPGAATTFALAFYAQSTILLTLDMGGLATFVVSV